MIQSNTPEQESVALLRHDLRNPIGQIIGYTEMLIEDTRASSDPAGLLADLEKVRAAGKTLLTIVEERLTHDALRGDAVTTPVTIPTPDRRTETARPNVITESDQHGHILVVDDVEANRDILLRRLEKQGHQTVGAASGSEALSLLAASPFDLVLLDIMMPEMDGYETLRRIKVDPDLRHVAVVMITALDEVDSVVRCIEMGAADYLPKPFDPVLLRARIGSCLREKRARDRETGLFVELQDSYRHLKDLETMRDDLTHMIVHDLRTPLTSILAGMQTVEAVGDLNEIQQEMLGLSLDGGHTLLGMINDLLDIDKMEKGSLQLEYGTVSPDELVHSSVAQVALLARNKNITLTEHSDNRLPPFSADGDKLRRTLVNLIGNALKFTPSGGTVDVSVQPSGSGMGLLIFAVRDSGEGIPKEAFDRIFEKFGQVENRKAGRKMSTGLGLTFSKMAVEAHGGRIWVESEPGQGSVFFFTLPLTAPGAP
ncbi:MAG: response regulator [Akkermansiaceae bacterium]|nr:response regulator [Armatimonadota bacterium]